MTVRNPKTTIAGYLIIAGSIIFAVAKFLQTGALDADTIKGVIGAITGAGLIGASDGGH